MEDHEGTIRVEYDDLSMKTKLVLTRFGGTFGTLGFNEKAFLFTLLGVTPYLDYKPTNVFHADSPGVYTMEKVFNLKKIDEIQLKCEFFDGNVVNGLLLPI